MLKDNSANREPILHLIIERIKKPDLAQLLILFFVLTLVVIVAAWPENPQSPNNSWSVLAQTKLALLIFFATLFGGLLRSASEKLTTLTSLACFHLFTLPLDTATYSASFPEVKFIWALSLPLIALFSYFMLGHFCSSLLNRLSLSFLAIPIAIALPIGAVFADIYLGRNLFNPFSSINHASLPYIVVSFVVGIIGLFILVRQALKNSSSKPT